MQQIVGAVYTEHSQHNSTRKRILNNWSFVWEPAFTIPDLKIWKLQGQVIEEADGHRPELRFTVTSPIVSYDGRVVKTASGSTYTLETQSEHTSYPVEDNPLVIPEEYLNSWINGDNWITI